MVHKRSDIRKGDILFASISPLGRCYLIDEEPTDWDINESVFSIRANEKLVTPEYLYMFLTSMQFIKNAEDTSTGSIFKGIRISDLLEMKIAIPSNNEIIKISRIIQNILKYKHSLSDAVESFKDINNYLFKLFLEGQTYFE